MVKRTRGCVCPPGVGGARSTTCDDSNARATHESKRGSGSGERYHGFGAGYPQRPEAEVLHEVHRSSMRPRRTRCPTLNPRCAALPRLGKFKVMHAYRLACNRDFSAYSARCAVFSYCRRVCSEGVMVESSLAPDAFILRFPSSTGY